jgi:very-short-patch-repair endonuclease
MARLPSRETFRNVLRRQAKAMRREPTRAEAKLWEALRNRQRGAKIRRQFPIDRYIVDFYCAEARLAIEVDGGIHRERTEEDANRQAFLELLGVRVIRFTNDEVTGQIDSVLQRIDVATQERIQRFVAMGSHPGPLHKTRPFTRRG